LERVLLKVYRLWEHGAMAPVRPLLDEERLRLATALRSLATSNISQSEDAILLFLEAISKLEPIATIGQAEFALLPEVKQAVIKARKPVLRIRGHKTKPTNLTPARMQGLLGMLEAVDPPTYAVGKLFFPGDLTALADLLETAMALLFAQWRLLALETRGAILRIVHTVRVGLVEEEGHHLVTVRSIVETLHQFEAMPEVMQFARDAFLAGKVDTPPDEPFRFNAMAIISDRLAEMIADPPPIHPTAQASEPPKPPAEAPRDRQPATPPTPEPEPPQPSNGRQEAEPTPPTTQEPVVPGDGQDALPQPVIEPAPPMAEPRPRPDVVERDFHTDVRFPQQLRMGEESPLVVRLTRAPFALSRADGQVAVQFGEPDQPEYVEVVIVAQGFTESTASWSRTMAVYSDRDSQPAVFLLRAGAELGEKRVTLDFYHKARYLGSAAFTTRIVEQAPHAVGGVTLDHPGLAARFVEQPPPPADLELRIVRGNQDNMLHFMLHSTRAGVGYHWRPVGQVQLKAANPQAYLEELFAHLGTLAAKPVDRLSEADALIGAGDIAAIGQQIFRELLPAELQHEFWARILPRRKIEGNPQGAIRTLLITSDEPWIPWEMMRPYRVNPETSEEESQGYLAELFQVSRWLAGRSPADHVHVRAAGLVTSGADLVYSQREEAYFRQLPARRVQVAGPLRSAAAVRQLLLSGGVQLVHFAAHGRFDGRNVDLSPLSLEDGRLTPLDLTGARGAGLRREQPLVFLNACHTARLAFALTGLGGWAERLINDLGVSAFVGTLWEVNDLLAAEFAIAFYDRLLAGDTLGQAFYTARLAVRDRQPANPTWLAYVLYGDPNSKVEWGAAAEEAAEVTQTLADAGLTLLEPEPPFDPAELAQALEAALAELLPEIVRRSIPGAVASAVAHATGAEVDATDVAEPLGPTLLDRPADKPADKPGEAPTEKPAEPPADTPAPATPPATTTDAATEDEPPLWDAGGFAPEADEPPAADDDEDTPDADLRWDPNRAGGL
jgi:hypothetical protein